MPFILILLLSITSSEHIVKSGETLSSIGAAHSLGWKLIAKENGIANPNSIRVGQRLRLPGVPSLSPVEPPPAVSHQELSIIDAVGFLEVFRGGGTLRLTKGESLFPGDVISTSRGGRALLSGMGGERVELGAQTVAVIHELSATSADRRVVVRIDRGDLTFEAPHHQDAFPLLARYLFETPTGSVSTRSGKISIRVSPPENTAVSVHAGDATVILPRGSMDITAGNGLLVKTLDLPERPVPLPRAPGLSIETSPGLAIAAAATQPSYIIIFDVFEDPDYQKQVAHRVIEPDRLGIALARIPLAPGKYWMRSHAVDSRGLTGAAARATPVVIN